MRLRPRNRCRGRGIKACIVNVYSRTLPRTTGTNFELVLSIKLVCLTQLSDQVNNKRIYRQSVTGDQIRLRIMTRT